MLLGNIDVLMLSQYSDDAVAAVGLGESTHHGWFMVLGIVALGSSIQLMQLIGSPKRQYYKIRHQTLDLFKRDGFHWFSTCIFIFGRRFLRWIQTPAESLMVRIRI